MEDREMIFYASIYTEGIIRDAIASRIYLRRIIDSLNADIMNISDEQDSSQHVLGAYEAFFNILQKELKERNIEKVEIGFALDVTGCSVDHTIEMTPNSFFVCSEGQREECTLEDVLRDMYEPKHVIGLVVGAITRQQNKILIDELKSGVKYVTDLVANEDKRLENSDILCHINGSDNHRMDAGYDPTTQGQADIGTGGPAAFSDGKKGSGLEGYNREDNDSQPKKLNSSEYNDDS
jgi:hypothetical protein